ncbi:MAG: NAD+ synthase [Actinomycetes bacterium]
MTEFLRVGLAQVNPKVGDLEGNARLIIEAAASAAEQSCDVVVMPEMALTGYPPEDLLLSDAFTDASMDVLASLAGDLEGPVAIVGCVERRSEGLFNSLAIISDRRVTGFARKCRLPNYGVFDERRYFSASPSGTIFELGGVKVALSICEDIWFPGEPTAAAVAAGARLVINSSASPFHAGKGRERARMLSERAVEHGIPIAYCALVGGQDELVFDGQSLVVDSAGRLIGRAGQFQSDLLVVDVPLAEGRSPEETGLAPVARIGRAGSVRTTATAAEVLAPELDSIHEVESALQLGLRDYVGKNGFNGVVLGVSGGIDSAVALTLAVDALGADRVRGVVMPSPWSSDETQSDARLICSNLGVEAFDVPIELAMGAYAESLASVPSGPGDALADENIQARIRGNLLMALSNRHGWLVVTTGNKSELAVGYSTLYGDAAGGFGLLKDVPKGTVYDLARLRNARSDSPIPTSIIERAPSAELRPGQRDEDSLPAYPILDEILRLYVEERCDLDEIANRGLDRETVEQVLRLVDRAEYKRRQYPPGVKITPLAFGRDRRMPMTNGFRG